MDNSYKKDGGYDVKTNGKAAFFHRIYGASGKNSWADAR